MGSTSTVSELSSARPATRFDRRLAKILEHATAIFCEKGYEGASMRDLSRASGMSLAGLYYYFESKEKLLYLIQKDLFTTVMELLRERLKDVSDPEVRVRTFIQNHVEFFLSKPKAMKVLSHEDDVLSDELGKEIAALKRQYYHSCADLIEVLKRDKNLDLNSRAAVMSLFGMINWLHTWYNLRVDGTPRVLATEISDIFLRGIYSAPRQ
ncbi:MAG: TetR/AcrR family transcriptional regulator [Acidobacteriia bacterium]|nr:TetR/AcrR family transcriptional regulator [Terriglobia bacterium]